VADTVKRIVDCGIPVMGHIGLTPQSINQLGGYKVQGKTSQAVRKLLDDALALEAAGVFAIILEVVPTPLATLITGKVSVPVIGIGAGGGCDGQVQVISDILGASEGCCFKHAKKYADLAGVIRDAVSRYDAEVKDGSFPTDEQGFSMDESLLDGLK